MTWQGVKKGSCHVTVGVGVGVTGIDVSITGSHNFNRDLTLRTLPRSFFLDVWQP